MVWAKIDDQFTDHEKVVGLSLAAKGLWLCGLVYSARRLTDGFVSEDVVARECYNAESDSLTWPELSNELVNAGLWERADRGFQIHDYLEYNPSKAQVQAERTTLSEKRAAAGKAGAAARWQADGNSYGKRMANGMANEWQTDGPVPVPVPVPVPDETEAPIVASVSSADAPKAKRRQQVPEDFQPDDAGVNYALSHGMPFEQVPRQVEKFVNHHRSKGTTFLDVAKAWQTWAGNYQEFGRPRSPTGGANGRIDFHARAEAALATERNQQ